MYRNFYNFTSRPFELSPDPKFLWLGEKYKEGLAAVRYGILTKAGFLSLTGDVGTGKTTLVNALANSLKDNIIFGKIPDPYLKTLDFFNFAANAFEMNKKFSTKGEFLRHLEDFLHNAHAAHKKVLLIIEEAQRLSQALLEEVRLLSNIEKQNEKLISILFVGQNEFNDKLKKNRALKQRVIISYHIQSLTEIETKGYIRHRLRIAGSKTGIFSQGAIHEIYAFSKGNPRLINVVCDLALLSGYLKETKIIEPQIIKDCAAEYEKSDQKEADFIEGQIPLAKPIQETGESVEPKTIAHFNPEVSEKSSKKPGRRRAAYLAVILPLILLIFFGYFYFFNGNHPSVANLKPFLQQSLGWFTVSQSDTSLPNTQIDKATDAGSEIKILSDNSDRGHTPVPESNNNANQQEKIALLQSRLLDIKSQKAAGEMQLSQLQLGYDALVLDLKELKGSQERIAELESVVATKEQALSQFEQRLNELDKDLDQKKNSKDMSSAELATKNALVAELQEKLEASESNQVKLIDDIARSKEQTAQLQSQLSDLNAQKTSAENQLTQLKTRNDALVTEIEELKGSQERLETLETGVEQRNQTLSVFENKLKDLENALNQEKNTKDKLKAELSAKTAQVEDLQQKLNTFQAGHDNLEDQIDRSKSEIAQLKDQLSDLKTKQASAPIAPVVLKMQEKLPAENDTSKKEAKSANPDAIIDWVLKKKSE